jgi:hypothetical protein
LRIVLVMILDAPRRGQDWGPERCHGDEGGPFAARLWQKGWTGRFLSDKRPLSARPLDVRSWPFSDHRTCEHERFDGRGRSSTHCRRSRFSEADYQRTFLPDRVRPGLLRVQSAQERRKPPAKVIFKTPCESLEPDRIHRGSLRLRNSRDRPHRQYAVGGRQRLDQARWDRTVDVD